MFDKLLMSNIMKHVEEFSSKMEQVQAELAKKIVTGEAGGGMVKVTMNGQREVLNVKIEPEVVNDLEMLEELTCAAVNDVLAKVQELSTEKITSLTGGINLAKFIPGLGL